MAALEVEVSNQATRLELANFEKVQMTSEVADLIERLIKAEEKIVELQAANVELNAARDQAIATLISTQEELKYSMSDNFKKNIIDDFKSSAAYHEEIGHEAGSFLDKGCAHIIRQLHPYFEDKSVLLQVLQSNFDNQVYRHGADFIPFTTEELDALQERDEKRGKPFWNPPNPSTPTFWEMLDGSGSAP